MHVDDVFMVVVAHDHHLIEQQLASLLLPQIHSLHSNLLPVLTFIRRYANNACEEEGNTGFSILEGAATPKSGHPPRLQPIPVAEET